MKKVTKISKFLMVFGATLLVSACGTGSSSSSIPEEQPIIINSLKDGLRFMNQEKNFTIDVYANKKLYYSIYYTEDCIGADSEGAQYMNLYVNDGKGIFSLNTTNDNVVSGEYELDENGQRKHDLYDGTVYPCFYNVANSYIDSFDESVNETEIGSKLWKINFIEAIGFTQTSYVSLDYCKAKYDKDNNAIVIDVSFNNSTYLYSCVVNKFGISSNNHHKTFMKTDGKAFEPNHTLEKFRELIKMDNFMRMTYDFDAGTYISMEYFHPNYFYTKYITSNTYYGYMSMNHKKTGDDDQDLKGCYFFQVDDKGQPHFNSTKFSDEPDIPKFFHYPKYLELLNKMQYFQKGTHRDVTTYEKGTEKYVVYDENLIKDFAKNFSLNQTWDFNQAPPYALAVEFSMEDTVLSKNKVVFHYLMKYNRQSYDYIIPITGFGKSDVSLLDTVYDAYND